MAPQAQADTKRLKVGLAYWMRRVRGKSANVGRRLNPGAVHALRVALRRCRSMADGMMSVDPDPDWKGMKKASRRLTRGLGELRDIQVQIDRTAELRMPEDTLGRIVFEVLRSRELRVREAAAEALREFDRREWKAWSRRLPERARRVPPGSPAYELLALKGWEQAYARHREAMHGPSQAAFHRLRIALKRFRYTVENFLPQRHADWADDFKKLQTLLGEIHDLDVLWATARRVGAKAAPRDRARWKKQIERQRKLCLDAYRERMIGRKSLWRAWREKLPQGERLEAAAMERFAVWASFLDPDFAHAQHVAELALQLQQGLAAQGVVADHARPRLRALLRGAALMHDVGRAKAKAGHYKASYRLIRKLEPPPGWTPEEIKEMALVARYHQGTVPGPKQKGFGSLPAPQQRETLLLAGILRLACTLDAYHTGSVRKIEVENEPDAVIVWATGYEEEEPLASWLAGSRHLLEMVCQRPVFVRGAVSRS